MTPCGCVYSNRYCSAGFTSPPTVASPAPLSLPGPFPWLRLVGLHIAACLHPEEVPSATVVHCRGSVPFRRGMAGDVPVKLCSPRSMAALRIESSERTRSPVGAWYLLHRAELPRRLSFRASGASASARGRARAPGLRDPSPLVAIHALYFAHLRTSGSIPVSSRGLGL